MAKAILKINSNGELVQYNERLRRWELVSKAWSWSDIDEDELEESKENWKMYKESIGEGENDGEDEAEQKAVLKDEALKIEEIEN